MDIDRTIATLWVKLGIDEQELNVGAERVKTKLEGLAGDIKQLSVPLAALTAASYGASEKFGGMAQHLKDLSFQTGISTQDLQRLQYAAMLSGTEFGSVSTALNKMTLSMAEAKDPASAAYKAFMGIGVDPSGKTPKQVFDETAMALVGMKDETARNSAAMAIYGRSWKDLLPYMQTYIDKSAEIQKAPVFSKKELDDLDDAKVAWDKLSNSLTIYSGRSIAFIDTLQNKLNQYNLVKKWFGWDEASIDTAVNTLIPETPAGSETPAGGGAGAGGAGGTGPMQTGIGIGEPVPSSLINPYEGGSVGSNSIPGAANTLQGVDQYNSLLSDLYGSAWIGSETKGKFGALEESPAYLYQQNLRNLLNYSITNPNNPAFQDLIKRRSASGVYIGSNETDPSILMDYMTGGGTAQYSISQNDLNAKISALRATLAAEYAKKQAYQATITQINNGIIDPMAAAAALSRALAGQLNQGGLT